MHQYAYGATYSKLNNTEFILPSDWEGTKLFKNQYHKVSSNDNLRLELNQTFKDWRTKERINKIVTSQYPNAIEINPEIYPQNYKKYDNEIYFDSIAAYGNFVYAKMSRDFLLKVFEFSDEVKNTEAYKYWSSIKGTYDIAHLRRDDISDPNFNKNNLQGYSVISKDSYYKAFDKYGFNSDNIIWVSDDYLNKWHIDRKKTKILGWSYPIGSNYDSEIIFDWLEDFLKIYFARTIFRANSSFSWWASFLSPTAVVYSPIMDKRVIYGVDALQEIDVDFVKGNYPHWMYSETGLKEIRIPGDNK